MASSLKRRRILLLTHQDLVPPASIEGLDDKDVASFRTEWDVRSALEGLGHDVCCIGLYDELAPLRRALEEHRPEVVFNLLVEFREQVIYDAHVVGYLELLRAAYTGCNPRGLVIARDKALSKKVLSYHRIRCPKFTVYPRHRKVRLPRHLEFPLIVKSLIHEGSEGIAQASVVHDERALVERVAFVHDKVMADAIAEQYIPGRELYTSVLGLDRFTVLPTWEIELSGLPADAHRIATRKVKWDLDYQHRHGIVLGRAHGLSAELEQRIARTARRICRRLGIDGYCRIDFRLGEDGELYFLEANPNPDIADGDELAGAAKAAGMDYPALLQRIIRLGMRRGRHN